MKITEFEINSYGPLKNGEKIVPGNFALFYGMNENGKTLTIDALIKLIAGNKVKDFQHIDRIKEFPSGYLKMEFGDDVIKRLPDDGDIQQITKSMDMPLTSFDFRNIFIIRNSDLTISDEAKFYTGITDKLVGLRTGDIGRIRKNILENAKITPALAFRDDEKSSRLKTRLTKAKELFQRAIKVRDRLIAGNFDKLELDLTVKARQIQSLKERVLLIEEARNRSLYEKTDGLLKNLEQCVVQIRNMEPFRDEDAEAWAYSERELNRFKNEFIELKNKEKELESARNSIKTKINEIKSVAETLEKKKNIIENEKFRLKNLQGTEHEISADISLRKLVMRLSVISSVLAIAVAASWLFYDSLYLYIAGTILLLISFGLWLYEIILILKRKKFSREFADVALNLSECGIESGNVEHALSSIGKFYEQYDKVQSGMRSAESELIAAERHIGDLKERMNMCSVDSEKLEKRILSLKSSSGTNSLDEYRKSLSAKKNLEKERDSISDRLRGMLGIQSGSTGELMERIKRRISELVIFKDKATGFEFDQIIYDDMKDKIRLAENELQSMNEKNELIKTEMSGLEAASNEVLVEYNEKFFCRTISDLNEVCAKLSSFLSENESTRAAAAEAINILNEIEADEKDRVHELFRNDNPNAVSGLFKGITGGLYNDVVYDPEAEAVRVAHSNGSMLNPEQLSGGAYDQLYMTVRIALGNRMLNHEKGFFILDDPFIKSDINRIRKQIEILKKIAETGWQILYFTCKDEIKDILLKDIQQKAVSFFEIKMGAGLFV